MSEATRNWIRQGNESSYAKTYDYMTFRVWRMGHKVWRLQIGDIVIDDFECKRDAQLMAYDTARLWGRVDT